MREYHYTLYYYDQAGNLVKTVPPAGVDARHSDTAFLLSVKAARAQSSGPVVPVHTLATEYRYNTLNRVVAQKTPDAGRSAFWYDRLGRLAVSQNAKQAAEGKYSYTEYDALGRITMVGQKPSGTAMTTSISRSVSGLESWLNATQNKEQITRTVYDLGYYAGEQPSLLAPTLYQKNLRNRVSYTQVIDAEPAGTDPNKWAAEHSAATLYSYDIHGNVDTLVQDYGSSLYHPNVMNTTGNRWKKMVYDYDLISGKVNMVAYQPGYRDEFYHRFEYDAENRIKAAETSRDKILWERDARYEYYKHGPLARTVTGQEQVQGTDYAYTLQGWLKGVNSTSMFKGEYDMGADGRSGSANSLISRDAYGYALNYFTDDHLAIGGVYPFVMNDVHDLPNTDAETVAKKLYNGNIASMFVNIPKIGVSHLYGYTYDQLNRIGSMDAFDKFDESSNEWSSGANATNAYQERVSYDANGNILTYLRNGANDGVLLPAMDQLSYNYSYTGGGKLLHNKLNYVSDAVTATNYSNDIDDQGTSNYGYDEIGNLIKDEGENISSIEWTVYGKIRTISKSSLSVNISYTYDAAGNRISKGHAVSEEGRGKETWYVRDASGNVMSVYTNIEGEKESTVWGQKEVHLYGSSRLGVYTVNRNVSELAEVDHDDEISSFERGNKFFELTNHLGNVLVTVTDRRIQFEDRESGDYYEADVATANDYYPGGMQMSGRSYSSGSSDYRYGFNGKENDAKDGVVQYDYGFRIYDPRLVRFKSVDPLLKKYPDLTRYQFASNNPIEGVDLDGLEYLSSKDARIEIIRGIVQLKIENMNSVVKNALNDYNSNPDNWKSGEIGVDMSIGKISFGLIIPQPPSSDSDPSDGNPNYRPDRMTVGNPKAASTGLPDRRYKERTVTTASPGGVKGFAIAAIAMEAIVGGYSLYVRCKAGQENDLIKEQVNALKMAAADVNYALKNTSIISKELQTEEYLSDIINVVLSGTSNVNKFDKKMGTAILKAGKQIYNTLSIKRSTVTGKVVELSKLDGVTKKVPEPNLNYDPKYVKENPPVGGN